MVANSRSLFPSYVSAGDILLLTWSRNFWGYHRLGFDDFLASDIHLLLNFKDGFAAIRIVV